VTHALLLLLLAQAEPAYVRSVTTTGNPDSPNACLHWVPGRVEMRQSEQGDPDVPGEDELDAVGRAIERWKAQFETCGNLTIAEGARTPDRIVGYRAGARNNQNLLLFRNAICTDVVQPDDPCWLNGSCGNAYDCWEHSQGTIALTTTSFDRDTGRLFDADVEANAVGFFFTTVDEPECPAGDIGSDCIAFDVQNTFTHELGHVFGLAHTDVPDSTMNPSAPLGEISKRELDPGTAAFVCDAYPRGLPSTDCRPPPEHLSGTSFSCASTPGGETALGGWVVALAAGWFVLRSRHGSFAHHAGRHGLLGFEDAPLRHGAGALHEARQRADDGEGAGAGALPPPAGGPRLS
jgi:hypothetical protein